MSRPKSLNGNIEYIREFAPRWLESKFRFPCTISEDVISVVAQVYTFGEGSDIWLAGEQRQDIQLHLDILTAETNTSNSSELSETTTEE